MDGIDPPFTFRLAEIAVHRAGSIFHAAGSSGATSPVAALSPEQLNAANLVAGEKEAGFHRATVCGFAGCLPHKTLLDRRECGVILVLDLLEQESRVEAIGSAQLEHVRDASNDLNRSGFYAGCLV
jgi:hypothetical protein